MISWGDIGGKRKPSRFTPVSPTVAAPIPLFSLAPTKKQKDGSGKKGNFTFSFNFEWNWEISINKIENQTWNKANAGRFFKKSRVSLSLAVQLQKKAKVT